MLILMRKSKIMIRSLSLCVRDMCIYFNYKLLVDKQILLMLIVSVKNKILLILCNVPQSCRPTLINI